MLTMSVFGKCIQEYFDETQLLWRGSQLEQYKACSIPNMHFKMVDSGGERVIRVDRFRMARMIAGIQAFPLHKRLRVCSMSYKNNSCVCE